jgi:amino acid permease
MDSLQKSKSIYEDDEDDNLNFNYGTSRENLMSASQLYYKPARGESINSSRSRDLSFHEGHGDAPSCLKKGSFITRVWIMTSVSLGAGAFVQPKVVARVGYLQGVLIIFFFGLVTNYAQILLLTVLNAKERQEAFLLKNNIKNHSNKNAQEDPLVANNDAGESKYNSYSEVSNEVLGNTGLIISCLTMSISCLVANAGQLATATQMLHDLLCWYFTGSYDYPFSRQMRAGMLLFLGALILPFCINFSDLHSLRYISTVSVTTCIVLVFSMIYLAVYKIATEGYASGEDAAPQVVWDIRGVIGGSAAICFAYSSIINVVSVYNEDISHVNNNSTSPRRNRNSNNKIDIHKRKLNKMIKVTSTASLICCFLYSSLSFASVLAWGQKCQRNTGNILYMIPLDQYWVTFWCFCLVVAITLLYPLINVPVVNNFEGLVLILLTGENPNTTLGKRKLEVILNKHQDGSIVKFLLNNRRSLISFFGMLIVICLDTFVTDLADLFGLCGSLGLGTISMILPALLAIKERKLLNSTTHLFGAAFLMFVGLIITFGSSSVIIYSLIKKAN